MDKIRVAIYARVSVQGKQNYERQLVELRDYAHKMNYHVEKEFSESISGAKHIAEREALTQLLDYVQTHKIDKVLVYECSRLSRRAVDFLAIIEMLTNLKVSVFVLQNGLETLLPNGQENPLANMVLGILAHFNSVERSVLRSRMTSGYNQFRAKGGKVGRKEGYRKSDDEMKAQYVEELKLLKKGISLQLIYKATGTSPNTLMKLKRLM